MKEPLFGLAAAAAAGILLADRWTFPGWWAGALGLFIACLVQKRWRSLWKHAAVAACFGLIHCGNLQDPLREKTTRQLPQGAARQGTLTGIVMDLPVAGFQGDTWQFPVHVESLTVGSEDWPAAGGRLDVRLYDSFSTPVYGDRVVLAGLLQRPDPVRNPGEFDFDTYLMRQGSAAAFSVDGSAGRWQILSPGNGNPLIAAALQARDWIGATVSRDLQDSPDIAATVRTMVLGSREKTPDEITDAFRASGTLHIFAVSGLHVALFAGVLWFALSRTGLRRGWIVGLSLALVFFYVFVTGLRPSAWRAALMISLVMLAPVWNRESNLFNSLGAAALMLLGYQTQQLFHAGFTLSFGVLLAIALFQKPFQTLASRCLGQWNAPDPLLPEILRTRNQSAWYWLREKICLSLGVSCASTLGSMPLMIGYFNLITPVGIFANLLLVTLALWILVVACLSLISGLFGLWFLVPLWNNANWALAWCSISIAKFFAALPLGHVRVDPARIWRGDPCNITVLALGGGGGAIRIDTPNGKQWLIDCGGLRHWNRTLRPHLERAPVNRLEGIFLTHRDSYHTGAMAQLTLLFPPAEVWENAPRLREGARRLESGSRILLDETVELEVLFPPPGWRAGVADDGAAVLRLKHRGFRILFMSDAGFITEKALLASGLDLRADVMVMGRHGSDFCGLPEFIRAVQPGAVIYTNDRYPEEERAPESWRQRLAEQATTGFDQSATGAVTINMDDSGMELQGFVDGQLWKKPSPPPAVPWSTLPEIPGPLIR